MYCVPYQNFGKPNLLPLPYQNFRYTKFGIQKKLLWFGILPKNQNLKKKEKKKKEKWAFIICKIANQNIIPKTNNTKSGHTIPNYQQWAQY